RPPMPDEMRSQTEPLLELVQALGFPLLRIPGVEADDVIGTLAVRAAAEGRKVLISTGDKDMAQLVNGHITLINTMTNTALDRDGVKAKFDVWPEQIIDYLALVGDSSDNIPGIEKVGPKTAAKWLGTYGTVDNLIAHALEIGGKVGENLRAGLETLALSRQLATIHTDVDLPPEENLYARRAPDRARLREIYARMEFRGMLRALDAEEAGAAGRIGGSAATAKAAAASGAISGAAAAGVATSGTAPSAADTAPSAASAANSADIAALAAIPRAYETIISEEGLQRWLDLLANAELTAFDTETTSLNYSQARIVGISFCIEPGQAAYLPMAHRYARAPDQLDLDRTLARLKPWREDATRGMVGHRLKYDAHVLRNHGIVLAGFRHDTMVESYVLNSVASRHDMDSLARLYLGIDTIKYEAVAGKGAKQICFDQVPVETASTYAAEDADVTLRLHRALWPQLAALPRLKTLYEEMEQPLASVLLEMEHRGVLLDAALLRQQSSELGARIGELQKQIHAAAGGEFNPDSPKQLQQILFEKLQLPVLRKTPTGQPSTAEDVLEELAEGFVLPCLILDYRGLTKLKSTYTDKLPGEIDPTTGRVHTCYHQAVAATGRLSSQDPNLQNIPIRNAEGRRIRQAFIAPPGQGLIAADYSPL